MVRDPGPAADAGPVDLVRREVAQRLVLALLVVELEVIRQPDHQLRQVPIAFEIDVLVLDAPPQAFDEDVVQGPTAPVHADGDAVFLQLSREGVRSELAALVAIENLRGAVGTERLLQAVHAEAAVQRVRDPPRQHLARVPVDHGHQVDETARQTHVGDVGGPDLVRMVDLHAAQQIGIDLVPGMGSRPRRGAYSAEREIPANAHWRLGANGSFRSIQPWRSLSGRSRTFFSASPVPFSAARSPNTAARRSQTHRPLSDRAWPRTGFPPDPGVPSSTVQPGSDAPRIPGRSG